MLLCTNGCVDLTTCTNGRYYRIVYSTITTYTYQDRVHGNTYFNHQQKLIDYCHSSCLTCNGPGVNDCTSCSAATMALTLDGRCVSCAYNFHAMNLAGTC